METGSWNFVSTGDGNGNGNGNDGRGQNGNCTTSGSLAWDIWQFGTSSRYDWIDTHHPPTITTTTTVAASTPTIGDASAFHALLHHQPPLAISAGMYAGTGTQFMNPPDPQLMCLKLGKRHYFEDAIPLGDRHVAVSKRGRAVPMPYYGYDYGPMGVTVAAPPPPPPRVPAVVVVPRCQVEGCEIGLSNGKDYHRRHKVCEMHSKAPKVKVHGVEQRFCQQCSRFHKVTEFDDSKRSCRRRLAGHNERRRKTSHDHSLVRSPQQGSFSSTPGHAALSLLSLKNNDHWKNFSSSDLSSRCSAALRELIAENRAYSSILGGKHQFLLDKDIDHTLIEEPHQNNTSHYNSDLANNHSLHDHDSRSWGCFNKAGTNVTLNLAPASTFELLSMRGKSNKDAEECSDIWSSIGGTNVV